MCPFHQSVFTSLEVPSLDGSACCKCRPGRFVVSCIDIKCWYLSLTTVVYNVHTFIVFCVVLGVEWALFCLQLFHY